MTRLILGFLAITLLSQEEAFTRNVVSCTHSVQAHCKPCYRPDPDPNKKVENKAPNVTDVELDRTELRLPPPKQGSPPTYPDYSDSLRVGVVTTAADPEGDVLMYNYTISGGRIVGTGTKVLWDLNEVMAGTYTLTAAVDDGCGLCGARMTKTVTVVENELTPACVCSEIRIDARHFRVESPDRVFVADLTGPRRPELTYQWTISEGSILSGQGTKAIKASRPEETSEQPVTVTVKVSGLDPTCGCPTTATKTYRY